MTDLTRLIDARFAARLAGHVDGEGKLVQAIGALAPLADRDVVLVDGGPSLAGALAAAGARVVVVVGAEAAESLCRSLDAAPPSSGTVRVVTGAAAATGLDDASADAIVGAFSAYRGVDAVEQAEADRILRPDGRQLVIHDYGRDDVSAFADADAPEYASWSRRNGPFLTGGFKIRVIHCWWTFDTPATAADVLGEAFGETGRAIALGLARPRLSYNVAIYHRTRGPR